MYLNKFLYPLGSPIQTALSLLQKGNKLTTWLESTYSLELELRILLAIQSDDKLW
jgi:hypothetical protein